MDHISDLPDELLRDILLFPRSPDAAARTTVLSRRWIRTWAGLISPELVLEGGYRQPHGEFMDSIDAALAAFSAPTIGRVQFAIPRSDATEVPVLRVTSWLRFASQRLVGTLSLHVPNLVTKRGAGRREEQEQEIELPSCEGAIRITLNLPRKWSLRIQRASLFTVLTTLVSSQCPRLSNLILKVTLAAASNVSIHSDSLFSLTYNVARTCRIEIVAPKLEKLSLLFIDEALISAPKLADVNVHGGSRRYHFVDETGHRLHLLEVKRISASLMQQFDKVEELKLCLSILQGKEEYESFVYDTTEFPMCDILHILWESSTRRCHGFAPSMLNILRRCNSIKRFTVRFRYYRYSTSPPTICCPVSCPCRLLESCNNPIDITLSLLEDVEIDFVEGSHEEVELFVKQLSRCKATVLRKVVINYRSHHAPLITKELRAKVRGMCRPNLNIEFNVPYSARSVFKY